MVHNEFALTFLMENILALGANTMPADAQAPNVTRASADMVLAAYDNIIAYMYRGDCWSDWTLLQLPVQLATNPVQSHD